MQQASIDFLEEHWHKWEMYSSAQILTHMDGNVISGLVNVIREEWDAGYITNEWCSPCVANTLKYAYTQYEKYKKENELK